MRDFVAYLVTNTVTDLRYVGITSQRLNDRWLKHISDARHGQSQPLQAAIREFGRKAFVVEHVASMRSLFDAHETEAALIIQWNTARPHGYNALRRSNMVPALEANCKCERCGRGFRQKQSRIDSGRGRFCSRRCRWKASIADKLWRRVSKTDSCWNWTGCTAVGYGRIFVTIKSGKRARKSLLVHRISYELAKGPIPTGLHIDHLCRNTLCVNPDHLEAVTCAINNHRGISPAANNKRKTHCKHGHPLSGENLVARKGCKGRPARECLECRRARGYRWRERKRSHSGSGVALQHRIGR